MALHRAGQMVGGYAGSHGAHQSCGAGWLEFGGPTGVVFCGGCRRTSWKTDSMPAPKSFQRSETPNPHMETAFVLGASLDPYGAFWGFSMRDE